ncbi:M15 family metallopeptidase [Galactobacter valiniphilus]|uniref:M15 family metallopeptidase n=1 Tax=Galactobacter valiniphilus TaxID=2676122 RepID=UPI0011C4467A|nr:M15 family metallopeptidase [Galactobacter valiniphilus]
MPLRTRPRPVWGRTELGRLVIVVCIVATMLSVALVALKFGMRDRAEARASLPGPVVSTPAPLPNGAKPEVSTTPTASSTPLPGPAQRPAQRPAKAPTAPTDPASFGVLVNKDRALNPTSYVPKDLTKVNGEEIRSDAGAALRQLIKAADKAGHQLTLRSGYRSAAYQQQLHERYAAEDGEAEADRKSARPGHSEHQTGLGADVTSSDHPELDQDFGSTAAGKWMAQHATEYGFIVRFPQGKESVTGYMWEPWHLRYLGKDLAADFVASGAATLEEYYGVD